LPEAQRGVPANAVLPHNSFRRDTNMHVFHPRQILQNRNDTIEQPIAAMRIFLALLFALLLAAPSVPGATAEADGNRGTRKACHVGGTPPGTPRKWIAAFAFLPPSPDAARMENSDATTCAAALKVARLVATASLALAVISSSPSPAGAAVDIAHGSRLFSAECAVCHRNGGNKMNTLKSLQKEALETYQSLESGQIKTYLSSQIPHALIRFPTLATTQDYDDVIAFVLDQAINNRWKQQ
jgi:cytochrome c6